ncbi:MAG: hypothetical protein LBD93_11920 [Treponema sp.]|jgi:MoaA/NifB/PqqE/SkfB family radical SAM enzyme|nr:hypothetical protein [Treponema sp.]
MRDIQARKSANLLKSLTYPCFNGCGEKNTWIPLPVVPSCNIQCNYCLGRENCGHNATEWHAEDLKGILEMLEDCDGVITMRKEFGKTFTRERIHA